MILILVCVCVCVCACAAQRGAIKETHLPFEGFLEALCRVSVLKALPTDHEIDAAGASHAGTHLETMRKDDRAGYEKLMATRAQPFEEEEPRLQPLHRCVAHLLEVLFYAIESTAKGHDLLVTSKVMEKWILTTWPRGTQ